MGHGVRLILPAYVKPFVKRQKKDMADDEAFCEAAQRPTMRSVTPKSAEAQGSAVVFRTRDLLIRQRTQRINALRGPLAELGFVFRKGAARTARVIDVVDDPSSDLPAEARPVLAIIAQSPRVLQGPWAPCRQSDRALAASGRLRALRTGFRPDMVVDELTDEIPHATEDPEALAPLQTRLSARALLT